MMCSSISIIILYSTPVVEGKVSLFPFLSTLQVDDCAVTVLTAHELISPQSTVRLEAVGLGRASPPQPSPCSRTWPKYPHPASCANLQLASPLPLCSCFGLLLLSVVPAACGLFLLGVVLTAACASAVCTPREPRFFTSPVSANTWGSHSFGW